MALNVFTVWIFILSIIAVIIAGIDVWDQTKDK
jgi:hypothetical protein